MKCFLEPLLYKLRFREISGHVPKNGKICDICCGAKGSFLFEARNLISEGVGLDKEVEPRQEENIIFKKVSIDKEIKEDSNYFDCVVLLAAIEHLSYPQEIIQECYRILRPGGKILITTPSPKGKWLLEFLAFKIGVVSPKEISDHKQYFSKESLSEICEQAGFKKENIVIKKFEFGYNIFLCAKKE
ncbi:MAG: class I SAM-dependent methyltransferase [bacterium]